MSVKILASKPRTAILLTYLLFIALQEIDLCVCGLNWGSDVSFDLIIFLISPSFGASGELCFVIVAFLGYNLYGVLYLKKYQDHYQIYDSSRGLLKEKNLMRILG